MSVSFQMDGIAELQAGLARLRAAVLPAHTLVPRKLVAAEMMLRTHDRFVDGTNPDGSLWPPSRAAGDRGGQTLLDKGILLASIHFEPEGGDVLGWSNDRRARTFQEGLLITPKNAKALAIPASPEIARAYRAGVSIREQFPGGFVRRFGNSVWLVRKREIAKSGNVLAFIAARDSLEFLFKLVPSVQEAQRTIVGIGDADLDMVVETFSTYFGDTWEGRS